MYSCFVDYYSFYFIENKILYALFLNCSICSLCRKKNRKLINDRQKKNLSEIVLISNNARKLIIHYMIVSDYVIHLGTYIALNSCSRTRQSLVLDRASCLLGGISVSHTLNNKYIFKSVATYYAITYWTPNVLQKSNRNQ